MLLNVASLFSDKAAMLLRQSARQSESSRSKSAIVKHRSSKQVGLVACAIILRSERKNMSTIQATRLSPRRNFSAPAALLFVSFCLMGCGGGGDAPPAATAPSVAEEDSFAVSTAKAHGKDAWSLHKAFETGLKIEFGGNTALDGTMLLDVRSDRARIELKNGTVLIWDGSDAWVSPASAKIERARFHVRTWPYFLLAPIKLEDPGAVIAETGRDTLADKSYRTARLTFSRNIGDTPDDWYIVYKNRETGLIEAMAYIVTFGKTKEQAEGDPHAIVYSNFADVGGFKVPLEWSFRSWRSGQGLTGDPLGKATLTNPQFVDLPESAFTKPDDARADEMPKPSPAKN